MKLAFVFISLLVSSIAWGGDMGPYVKACDFGETDSLNAYACLYNAVLRDEQGEPQPEIVADICDKNDRPADQFRACFMEALPGIEIPVGFPRPKKSECRLTADNFYQNATAFQLQSIWSCIVLSQVTNRPKLDIFVVGAPQYSYRQFGVYLDTNESDVKRELWPAKASLKEYSPEALKLKVSYKYSPFKRGRTEYYMNFSNKVLSVKHSRKGLLFWKKKWNRVQDCEKLF